jgi:hypothetical protein
MMPMHYLLPRHLSRNENVICGWPYPLVQWAFGVTICRRWTRLYAEDVG